MSAELVEYDDILDEIEVKVGALLLSPSLTQVKQKDSLATV
jgi:hypothetical protein